VDELENQAIMSFLKERVPSANVTMSVCSGSWILAKAGLLDGHRATSNKAYFKMATEQSDQVEWISEARWVEDGPIFTSSGVSAGMDMSLAVVASLFGEKKATEVAKVTEYVWNRNPNDDPFHECLETISSCLLRSNPLAPRFGIRISSRQILRGLRRLPHTFHNMWGRLPVYTQPFSILYCSSRKQGSISSCG
jgi:transcriptional regulator GlxA family with amidase domain